MKKLILIALICIVVKGAHAQDFHLSQYDAAAIYQNAAQTGMTENQYRVVFQTRSQWRSFARKPFLSHVATFDMPLNKRWGIGGYLISNEAAVGYNDQHIVLSGAYRISSPEQSKHLLSVGLQAGAINKILNQKLIFDSQYTSGVFDQSIASGENTSNFAKLLPELNMGISYVMSDENSTANPFIGLSVFHITSPNESYFSDAENLPRRFMFYTGCDFKISEKVNVTPRVLGMFQGKSQEINAGITGKYQLNNDDVSLLGEVAYRLDDAIIAGLGLYYKEFLYRISYDINTSGLKQFSGGRGAIEFSIVFRKK